MSSFCIHYLFRIKVEYEHTLPFTNLFRYLRSVPTVHFIETWDRSDRSFFFAIGTTQHKSLYGQSHNKCISLFGISPNRTFLQRPGIDPIGHFSLPSGPLDTKVHSDSSITNQFRYLGSVPTVHFYKGLGLIPQVIFLCHRDHSTQKFISTAH